MRRVTAGWRLLGLLAGVCVLMAAGASDVGASESHASGGGSGLLVTVAARSCPSYTDITGNLARNDIQESLRDLGPDTPYVSGEPIDPVKEADHQPNCSPISDWRFTLGTGIGGADKGTWGSLSFVSQPFSTSVVTQASTPMLDTNGHAVAGQSIAGATTFELDQDEANAASHHGLWIQGGTVDDPVLDKLYPGTYGFGALRCAIDNLNGDNVETVDFPSGSHHVFCYAYYVIPPPSSGTIVVRKEVRNAPNASESFVMGGNVSYDPSGTFSLNVNNGQPASQTFFRADTSGGAPPWTVQEQPTSGWKRLNLACTHGASTVTIDRAAGKATIDLAAGDTVTCTYTNVPAPTAGALIVRKITQGGVGTFPFTVTPTGGGTGMTRSITTKTAGVAVAWTPIKLGAGTYKITEGKPEGGDTLWKQTGLMCNGKTSDGTVTISAARGAVCTFTNTFTPLGRVEVREVTRGGLATAGYSISPRLNPDGSRAAPVQYDKIAKTTAQNTPAPAVGQVTTGISYGLYVIQQTQPHSSASGTWLLESVSCGGKLVPFAQGITLVRISASRPRVVCTFTNVLSRNLGVVNPLLPTVPPIPPPTTPPAPGTTAPPGVVIPPTSPPGQTPGVPGGPTANLAVAKHVDRTTAMVGDVVAYVITVRNTGKVDAPNVMVLDAPTGKPNLSSSHPSQGSCGYRLPLVCQLGTIKAGHTATVLVRLQVTQVGTARNLAVVGSGATETRLRDNVAVAHAVAVGENVRVTGCTAAVRAQAAC
jgi:uncharacterized repeat protein (TIGR01451 family)